MLSQRKLEANRLNAKKSTGPVTARGKAISSRNALKTGKYARVHHLTPLHEAETEIAGLEKDFARTFAPATPEEHRYIKTLATAEWAIRQFEEIFGMAVVSLVASARERDKAQPRLTLVPRRKAAPRETLTFTDALPPAA